MKRLFSALLSVCVLISLSLPVGAANEGTVVSHIETQLGNGITVIEETFEYANLRTSQRQGTKRQTYMFEGAAIAIIAFKATFVYDGLKSRVLSKQVTQTETYDGWTYTQSSFTSVADTVTLTGQLRKIATGTVSVNMSLTCDANGNIS